MSDAMRQVVRVWWRQTPLEEMLVLAAAPVAAAWLALALWWLWRRRRPAPEPGEPGRRRLAMQGLRWALIAVALGVGYHQVIGRASLFDDGIAHLESRTHLPVLGLIPWYDHIEIDSEDGMPLDVVIDPPAEG